MPIIEGITAAKAALETSKLLMGMINRPNLDRDDIRAKLSEMLIHLVNAQTSLGEAQLEVSGLRQRLEDKTRLEEFGKQFTFEHGVYWHRNFPYCPNCWDADRKPIMLDGPYRIANRDSMRNGERRGQWKCPIHDTVYYLSQPSDVT